MYTIKMEEDIAEKLKTKLFKNTGKSIGGCISSGDVYETDNGKVFIKKNSKLGADIMFKGEFHALLALGNAGLRVPTPILFGDSYLVMEYIPLKSLNVFSEQLGKDLANMHCGKLNSDSSKIGNIDNRITKFGFDYTTCCGFLPMCNDWTDDWVSFYARHRIEAFVNRLLSETGDRDLNREWSALQLKIPIFFQNVNVVPSLLHGDLWSGNTGETPEGPIVFDPGAYYGHDEFDLAIAKMWGGFSDKFFKSYHSVIPQRPGFKERHNLYLLFHHLNHWAHFGTQYRDSTLSLMQKLNRSTES